ncbi:MAG: hypothetical protein AB7I79_07090 [Rhizobiaceae bacterium]
MIRKISSRSTEALVEELFRHQVLCRLATRREDTPAANRHLVKIWQIADALAVTTAGRLALETLMEHSDPDIRLRGAEAAKAWNLNKAIPVLARLLIDDLDSRFSPVERLEVRISAAHQLYDHFGIRNYDQNHLIVPLSAYGIELQPIERTCWQPKGG